MKIPSMTVITAFLAVLILMGCASATQYTIDNVQINGAGGTATADLVMDVAPETGYSGYIMVLTVEDPAVAEISAVTYNSSLGGMTDTNDDDLPFTSGYIGWVDTGEKLETPGGQTNVLLATITFQGLSAGSTILNVTFTLLSADNGDNLIPVSSINIPEIDVYAAPEADFELDTTSPLAGEVIQFTDLSTGNPTSWAWDFENDGTIDSTEKDPSHTYTTAGTYTVKLTVTNPAGTDTETREDYITVTSSDPSGLVFSPEIKSVGIGETTEYRIYLEEAPLGLSGYDMVVSLATPGVAEITGVTYPSWGVLNNNPSVPHQSVLIQATDTGKLVQAGATDVLLATISVRGTGAGTSPLAMSSIYIYADGGSFIPVSVTNGEVTVTGSGSVPVAGFIATPVIGIAPLTVMFTDTSTNDPDEWNWEYRESGTSDSWTSFSTSQNPTRSFAAGAYDIRLTATNGAGSDTVTSTQYISASSGPMRLATVESGIVSGGLYTGAFQTVAYGTQVQYATNQFDQEFTIPDFTEIEWARLYAVIYASGTDARKGIAEVSFDGNGDGIYEILLGNETLATAATSAADVYPVNGHVNRQYSDYLIWYDVTDFISSVNPAAQVIASPVDSNFDSRIKTVILVVAYNDGDADTVQYWVNEGHDYQSSSGTSAVSTIFSTSPLPSGWASATLSNVMLSSKDAIYALNGDSFAGADSSAYFGNNVWDVGSSLVSGSDSSFTYLHGSGSFKTVLATLAVRFTEAEAPVAAFSANTTSGISPLSILFADASTGTITSYAWDFNNDGTIDSTVQSPTHMYPSAGIYTVNLTVTGPGGSDSEVKTNYITATAAQVAPVAAFSANITSGTSPLSVRFTDQSSNVPTSWIWEYRKGSGAWIQFSTVQNPVFSFSTAGTYDIRLTASNSEGSDEEMKAGCIIANPLVSTISADFSGTPRSGKSPLLVRFTDQSAGEITSYAWDFENDGTIDSRVRNPTNIYSKAGSYTVRLVVTGPDGTDEEVKEAYITVNDGRMPAIARFTQNKHLGTTPLTVQFTDQSIYYPDTHLWTFGDGTTSTEKNPQHTYPNPGIYIVRLRVSNENGSSSAIGFVLVQKELRFF